MRKISLLAAPALLLALAAAPATAAPLGGAATGPGVKSGSGPLEQVHWRGHRRGFYFYFAPRHRHWRHHHWRRWY